MGLKAFGIALLEPTKRKAEVLDKLLEGYRNVVSEAVDYAWKGGITSRKRLHGALYKELRLKHPSLPSHYIYTAFTVALGMVRASRRGRSLN